MKRFLYAVLGVTFVGLTAVGNADAQGFSITISIDENGVGSFSNTNGFFSPLPSALLPDPTAGGLASALTYSLLNPPGLTAGDLLILEPTAIVASDLLRFNPTETCSDGSTGCLVVYSDKDDPVLALADTGLPSVVSTHVVTVHEVGTEGNNGFTYTPTAGQPGFIAGAAGPVTYAFISDIPIPEPATLGLMGAALAGLGFARGRRNLKRQG